MITLDQIQQRYQKNEFFPYSSEREYLDSFLWQNYREEEQKNRKNYRFEILSSMSNGELMAMYYDTNIAIFKDEYQRRIKNHDEKEVIDWNKIKSENPIDITIERLYGIQWNRRVIKCPFKDHQERSASFSITRDGSYFQCFGCHKKGTILDFISLYE